MNIDEVNRTIRSLSKEDFDGFVEDQRRLILAGDLETMAQVQESAMHALILRLATLLPDDPLVEICVRVLHADKDAMVRLSDVLYAKMMNEASPAEVEKDT